MPVAELPEQLEEEPAEEEGEQEQEREEVVEEERAASPEKEEPVVKEEQPVSGREEVDSEPKRRREEKDSSGTYSLVSPCVLGSGKQPYLNLCKCLCRLVNALAWPKTTYLSLLLFQAVLGLGVSLSAPDAQIPLHPKSQWTNHRMSSST